MVESNASGFPELRFSAKLADGQHVCFFDCRFFPFTDSAADSIVGIVGGQEAIVFRLAEGNAARLEVLAWFHDDDDRTVLNSCCWALDPATGDPLLCVTGSSTRKVAKGWGSKAREEDRHVTLSIRVLDVKTNTLRRSLVGHGKEISDLTVLPTDPSIVASASMDLTVRLWSLRPEHQQQPCILLCAGDGHREGLLTLAFHDAGRYLLTGGMDHAVKLWHIPDNLRAAAPSDRPPTVHSPHFSTQGVHHGVVDCVAWYGDLILSRAAQEDKIVLWRIEGLHPTEAPPRPAPLDVGGSASASRSAFGGGYQRLLQFGAPHTQPFFMRFGLSRPLAGRPMLAMGTTEGRVLCWDLQSLEEWEDPRGAGPDAEGGAGDAHSPAAAGAREQAHRSKRGGRKGVARPLARPGPADDATTPSGLAVQAEDADLTADARRYSVEDPFRLVPCHRAAKAPAKFEAPQVAWSAGGEWMVVVGYGGTVNVYGRQAAPTT